MNGPPAFLDANVPMYAAGQPHAAKDACIWVMGEIAEGRIVAATSTEIIQEIVHRYDSLRRWRDGVTLALNLLGLIPTIYPVAVKDMRLAIELFEQYAPKGMRTRDLVHIAVMKNHGLDRIISVDGHFDLIAGIVRLDPQVLYSRAHQ